MSMCNIYSRYWRTNVFRAARTKAASDMSILREFGEVWRLDELLLLVCPTHFWAIEIAGVCERVELRFVLL